MGLMAGPNANGDRIEALRQKRDFNELRLVRFWIWFSDVIGFRLGRSEVSDRAVTCLIAAPAGVR
ncbi:MAG: ABC-type dipeptide/oligopeptide/nickel transport system permease component [Paracoccaceae bacterium]|jgi:ABC-type dipeptide/oligopeptide/nickel transport system permease component